MNFTHEHIVSLRFLLPMNTMICDILLLKWLTLTTELNIQRERSQLCELIKPGLRHHNRQHCAMLSNLA